MSVPTASGIRQSTSNDSASTTGTGFGAESHSEAIWRRLEPVIARFEEAFWRGERPDIAAFLPADDDDRAKLIPELVHAEIELRRKAGERVEIIDYLRRFPSLADHSSLAMPRGELGATPPTLDEFSDLAQRSPRGGGPSTAGRLVGRYRLQHEIGRGGFGVVYRARDTELGRDVAVKLLRQDHQATPAEAARLVREARSMAGLSHPNIVPVYDAGEWEGEPYLVSALIEGGNLAEEIAAQHPSFRQSAQWVAALADALEHAHQNGIIHRDVKPSNVLLDRDGRVHLTDFGLAKSDAAAALSMTVKGEIAGTPAYMAPEQAHGEKPHADARTDVYSLGVILYELLSGTRPFVGAGQRLLERIVQEDPRPPRRLNSTVPVDLETVCLKAMAKEPKNRYVSAGAFADDLRRWLAGEAVLARPESSIAAFWRRCRRKPFLSGLAASLILTIVVGFAAVTWLLTQSEAQRRRAEASLELAQTQRQRAVRALVQVNQTLSTLASLTDERLVGRALPSREELWKILLEHLQTFAEQVHDDPAFLRELADCSMQIAVWRDLSGSIELGIPAWRQVLERYERLVEKEPSNSHYQGRIFECLMTLAERLRRIGKRRDSQDLLLRSRNLCAGVLENIRRQAKASPVDRTARVDEMGWELRLGECERMLGRNEAAIAIFRRLNAKAEEIVREMPADVSSHHLAGRVCLVLASLLREKSSAEALTLAQRACEESEAALRAEPAAVLSLDSLSAAVHMLAGMEDYVDQADAALRDFRRAAEIDERLIRERPSDRRIWEAYAAAQHCIARILTDLGRPAEALEPFRKALERREALVRLSPEDVKWRCDLTGSWMRLGDALEALGRTIEAIAARRAAVAQQWQVCTREPGELGHWRCLDNQLRHLVRLFLSLDQTDEVIAAASQRTGRQGHEPDVILSAAGELAMAAVLFLVPRACALVSSLRPADDVR